MNPYNPYAPPQGPAAAAYHDASAEVSLDGNVPDAIVEPLRKTKGWVTFLAVVGFIGTGLMGLVGLFMLGAGRLVPGLPPAFGLIYLVLGAVYVAPSVLLIRYGSAIGRLVRDPRMERLVVALDHQRSFWKLIGVMTAVVIALYPVGIIVAVVVIAMKATH